MVNPENDKIPDNIKKRVRNESQSYIGRDLDLSIKYRYGDEIEHEPIKAIEKEIDGMARLLCAIVASEEITDSSDHLLQIYQDEVAGLRKLEEEVISELPERERYD